MFAHFSKKLWCATLGIASLLLAACGTPTVTPNPQSQINAAVAATIASIPTATAYPIPTPIPSPTNFSLDGLFCEYGFCIGHPTDMVLIDEGARHSPPSPSARANGILIGYTESLFIQVTWQISNPNFNPQTTMQLVMEEQETLQGNFDALLIRDMNIYYQPISTVTKLPYGGIATWQCGGRDFTWKIYSPQDNLASEFLKQSLERFRCS
jgi:hypothetical protein